MELKTKRLILRDVKIGDARDIARNANNINVSRYLGLVPHPYSLNDARNFIKNCIKKQREKPRKNYNLGISIKKEKSIIGMIRLLKIDSFNKTATIGYWLGERYWRQEIMSEVLEKVIYFAFKNLKLRRLNIDASTSNKGSNALIKKAGFKHEGTRIQYMASKSNGRIHDVHIYGLLGKDWIEKHKS